MSSMQDIEKLERALWESADQLRANSKLNSTEYSMPVLGLIFLRHATTRYNAVKSEIEKSLPSRGGKRRELTADDFKGRAAIFLPEKAQYDYLVNLPDSTNVGQAINEAMDTIEDQVNFLKGALPKTFTRFEPDLLRNLLRIFNRDALRVAEGDIFGRIYEYFLNKFALSGGLTDDGEVFTPPCLVRLIVNTIEPNHGIVFDPAAGSAGMFVQTSHFLEAHGSSARKVVTFYAQEKSESNANLSRMNLAVHGLEGSVLQGNTFYDRRAELIGKCDFVMANPPFNVDKVDAEKIDNDPRLPFGLPGVNKYKEVSNANYLWISYFWSYLGKNGRAGFVMSSQASSAGRDEKSVRRKIIETGDVDVMISIRSNFFYTRTVPCELWFFDRGKPTGRRDKVLMIDARNVYRKVTRKVNDFSPEQLKNLASIIWLYRDQQERFLSLVQDYLHQVCTESQGIPSALKSFETALSDLNKHLDPFIKSIEKNVKLQTEEKQIFVKATSELSDAVAAYETDRTILLAAITDFEKQYSALVPTTNDQQHALRQIFEPVAEGIRGLIKQVDLVYKLTAATVNLAGKLSGDNGLSSYDKRASNRIVKQLDEQRKNAVEQLKQPGYFYRQVVWLQDRFPDAELRSVPGLVKLTDRKSIERADWSLTPGRYVGVAPKEDDEDFDFEQTLRDIHVELVDLNQEASVLAGKIQDNFEELSI